MVSRLRSEEAGGSQIPKTESLDGAVRSYKTVGNHWQRYALARRYCKGKKVLDSGCGYGLGSLVLDQSFASYLGADTDSTAIKWAQDHIAVVRPLCRFRLVDDLEQLERALFDVIISFEVIEHVRSPQEYLRTLKAHLADGGIILLSTPNGIFSQHNAALFRSRYHVDEYNAVELDAITQSAGLKTVHLFGQSRRDKLDVLWLESEQRVARYHRNSKSAQASSSFRRLLTDAFTASYSLANHPCFWTIRSLTRSSVATRSYSTVIAVLTPEETKVA